MACTSAGHPVLPHLCAVPYLLSQALLRLTCFCSTSLDDQPLVLRDRHQRPAQARALTSTCSTLVALASKPLSNGSSASVALASTRGTTAPRGAGACIDMGSDHIYGIAMGPPSVHHLSAYISHVSNRIHQHEYTRSSAYCTTMCCLYNDIHFCAHMHLEHVTPCRILLRDITSRQVQMNAFITSSLGALFSCGCSASSLCV